MQDGGVSRAALATAIWRPEVEGTAVVRVRVGVRVTIGVRVRKSGSRG